MSDQLGQDSIRYLERFGYLFSSLHSSGIFFLITFRPIQFTFSFPRYSTWVYNFAETLFSCAKMIHSVSAFCIRDYLRFYMYCPVKRSRAFNSMYDWTIKNQRPAVNWNFISLILQSGRPHIIRGTLSINFHVHPKDKRIAWFTRVLGRFTNFRTVQLKVLPSKRSAESRCPELISEHEEILMTHLDNRGFLIEGTVWYFIHNVRWTLYLR